MSRLASIQSGNFSSSSVWGVMASVSTTLTGSETVTLTFSATRSQAFTPGAITISHIAVQLYERLGSTGTFSVRLIDSASSTEVTGTLVTINVSDLPTTPVLSGTIAQGWVMLKLSAPVTLAAATAYKIEAATSNSGQVRLTRQTSTTDDIARFLVTTTTAAPAAGDDLYIQREHTGTGTYNDIVVTMDNTATTDFGSDSTTNIYSSGIYIGGGGALRYGTASSTNYYLKVSGYVMISADGEFSIGKSGSEIPRDSTATLEFDCTASKRYGVYINNGGTFNSYGLSRSIAKEISWCHLNTDEAVNSTSLGVDQDTGWLDNDEIFVTSTTQSRTELESGTLNGNAGASSLTVDGFAGAGGGLAYSHLGTDPMVAEVGLLTRNVVIQGTASTLGMFIYIYAAGTLNLSWTRIRYYGSASTGLRGLYFDATNSTTGYVGMSHCAFTDPYVSAICFYVDGNATPSSVTRIELDNIISHGGNISAGSLSLNVNMTSDSVMNLSSGATMSNSLFVGVNGTIALALYYMEEITNITVACCAYANLAGSFRVAGDLRTVVSGIVIHSCQHSGLDLDSVFSNTVFQNCKIWRCVQYGVRIASTARNFLMDSCDVWGNTLGSLYLDSTINGVIKNCNFGSDSSYTSARDILIVGRAVGAGEGPGLTFYNCNVGVVSGIFTNPTSALYLSGRNNYGRIRFIECNFDYTTNFIEPASGYTDFYSGYYTNWMMSFVNCDGGSDIWSYIGNGILRRSTSVVRTGTYSMKIEPLIGSYKCTTPSFFMPVTSGNSLTPSVYVYEDASYNGNRARLIVKANDAIGITDDTVLATATVASDGAWEQLTAATAVASQDGVMEFVVDCDGTAGGLYIDDFTV